jgi:hypothetical protein
VPDIHGCPARRDRLPARDTIVSLNHLAFRQLSTSVLSLEAFGPSFCPKIVICKADVDTALTIPGNLC